MFLRLHRKNQRSHAKCKKANLKQKIFMETKKCKIQFTNWKTVSIKRKNLSSCPKLSPSAIIHAYAIILIMKIKIKLHCITVLLEKEIEINNQRVWNYSSINKSFVLIKLFCILHCRRHLWFFSFSLKKLPVFWTLSHSGQWFI